MKPLSCLFACAAAAMTLSLPCLAEPENEPGTSLSTLEVDRSFGVQGEVNSAIGKRARVDRFTHVAVDSRGRIVVVGQRDVFGGRKAHFARAILPAVARFLPDGSLDRSFGAGGVVALKLKGEAASLVLDSLDRVVLVGDFTGARKRAYGAVRLTQAGALDRSFSGDGLVEKGPTSGSGWRLAQRVPADDGVVIAAKSDDANFPGWSVVRIDGAGAYSGNFGPLGVAPVGTEEIVDVAVDASSRVVVGTTARVLRLRANGTRDFAFGIAGTLTVDESRTPVVPAPGGVEIDGQDRIVVQEPADGRGGERVLRYLDDGTPDASFSGDGRAVPLLAVPMDGHHEELHFRIADGRWVTASATLQTWAEGFAHSGVLVQVVDPAAPGAVAAAAVRDLPFPDAQDAWNYIKGLAVAPERPAAYVVGHRELLGTVRRHKCVPRLLCVDLTPRAPAPLPDVSMSWDEPPVLESQGSTHRVVGHLRVTNDGDAPVLRTQVRFFWSDDDTFDAADEDLVAGPVLGAIEPHASVVYDVGSVGWTGSGQSRRGRRFVAVANLTLEYMESDLTDDVLVSAPLE